MILVASLFLAGGAYVHAQSSPAVTLSVSPALFEPVSVNPNQRWSSSLRVTNINSFDLTVYPSVVNFEPDGEGGRVRFLPVDEENADGTTLAEWISISPDPVVVPEEQSVRIPFSVTVPPNAEPGGHSAAFIISTQPPADSETTAVRTSQAVTALLFVRVAGDIVEAGNIREFRTTRTILGEPEATFELRFENQGNVHLRPQGSITITNMWGQERGVIPINRRSHFGNVLPESVRRFTFTWSGEWSLADIGRYSAEATLAYGQDARQFTTRETGFWVIPIRPLLFFIGGLLFVLWIISTALKLYVRRMLTLAGIDPAHAPRRRQRRPVRGHDLAVGSYVSVGAPVSAGVQDLRMRWRAADAGWAKLQALCSFMVAYREFFGVLIVLLGCVSFIVWYVHSAGTPERSYEVVINNPDADIRLSSEEIIYQERYGERVLPQVSTTSPAIAVVNESGIVGRGADVRFSLERAGYPVTALETGSGPTRERTTIVYDPVESEAALTISDTLGGALLSSAGGDDHSFTAPLVVYLGEDQNQSEE